MNTNEIKQPINVLSLFDGISVGQLAISNLGIPYNYYASEIDPNAINLTQHHFPETNQLGDVRNIDTSELPPIQLLLVSSPCQDLSSSNKNRTGLSGSKSGLFYDAVRVLKEIRIKNPDVKFIFENVASMPSADRDIISAELGVQPKKLQSSDYAPALRSRYYWTNVNLRGPQRKKNLVLLQDALESDYADKIVANCVTTKPLAQTNNGALRYLKKSFGQIVWTNKAFCDLPKSKKIELLESGQVNYKDVGRKMTKTELCRMQTLPDNYCDILSYNQCHHAVGNSYTKNILILLLSYIKFD